MPTFGRVSGMARVYAKPEVGWCQIELLEGLG